MNSDKPKIIKRDKRPPSREKTLREQLNEVRGELLAAVGKVDALLKCEKLEKERDSVYI